MQSQYRAADLCVCTSGLTHLCQSGCLAHEELDNCLSQSNYHSRQDPWCSLCLASHSLSSIPLLADLFPVARVSKSLGCIAQLSSSSSKPAVEAACMLRQCAAAQNITDAVWFSCCWLSLWLTKIRAAVALYICYALSGQRQLGHLWYAEVPSVGCATPAGDVFQNTSS